MGESNADRKRGLNQFGKSLKRPRCTKQVAESRTAASSHKVTKGAKLHWRVKVSPTASSLSNEVPWNATVDKSNTLDAVESFLAASSDLPEEGEVANGDETASFISWTCLWDACVRWFGEACLVRQQKL